jgi:glycosyltransferase EpsF
MGDAQFGEAVSRASGRRKVLNVMGTIGQGGIETWLSKVLLRLDHSRIQADICFYRRTPGELQERFLEAGCNIIEIPLVNTPAGFMTFSRRFVRFVRERQYDVIHCHGVSFIGVLLICGRLAGVPVRIAHSHCAEEPPRSSVVVRGFLKLCRMAADMFATHRVGCSTGAVELIFGRKWRDRGATVMYCGIEVPKEVRTAPQIRGVLNVAPGALLAGCVANFTWQKNHIFLLNVFADLLQWRPDAHLVLVGDGPRRPLVEAAIAERNLQSRVHLLGRRPDVPDLLPAFDVVVLPSMFEGLPVALLEAQAFGIPCVTSTAVTQEVAVVPGLVSFVRLDRGVADWSRAVLRAAARENRRSAAESRSYLLGSEFDIDVCVDTLSRLYGSATR